MEHVTQPDLKGRLTQGNNE